MLSGWMGVSPSQWEESLCKTSTGSIRVGMFRIEEIWIGDKSFESSAAGARLKMPPQGQYGGNTAL